MGKYTRKAKVTVGVALMDVSQSHLGVRTRAKTLALQRLQSTAAAADAPSPPPSKPDPCYLELRSRRLEKSMQQDNSPTFRNSCGCRGEKDPEIGKDEEYALPSFASGPIEEEDLSIETSFGENNLDFETRARGTRESTPCSLIKTTDTIMTPGSTTKQARSTHSTQKVQNALLLNVPCARELEEFFAREEQPLQRHFIEKYNFDFGKELPLAGRYEWVSVRP
ncbi:hypothetical protein ABFS83_14G211600 [Erythranthe nasuta]